MRCCVFSEMIEEFLNSKLKKPLIRHSIIGRHYKPSVENITMYGSRLVSSRICGPWIPSFCIASENAFPFNFSLHFRSVWQHRSTRKLLTKRVETALELW